MVRNTFDTVSVLADREKTGFALGKHLTIEYYDCDPFVITNSEKVKDAFLKAAKLSGATILSSYFQEFTPQGVSGFVIISESHFSVHTWPEHDYAAVDIFTCGENIDFDTAIKSLENSLGSGEVVISANMSRGILTRNGFLRGRIAVGSPERYHSVHRNTYYTMSWKEKFEKVNAWGILTSLDIHNCNPEIIRDADKIKQYVYELCERIDMKRFGDCQVVHFGEEERVAGFSMTQLIETSLISGHFANATNASYIDIFSCKFYEPREAAEFSMQFFEGSYYKMHVTLRR